MSNPIRLLVMRRDHTCVETLLKHPTCRKFKVVFAPSAEAARAEIQRGDFDVVLVESDALAGDGIRLVKDLNSLDPFVVIVVLTDHGSVVFAVDFMKRGCFAYLEATCGVEDFLSTIERAHAERQRRLEKSEQEKLDAILQAATMESPRGILRKIKELYADDPKRTLQ